MKYVTAFFIFIGIWLVASFLNGLLSGICLSLLDNSKYGTETFSLSMIFSFVFSVPLVGLVWLVNTIAQISGKTGAALFQLVLRTAIFCSLAGAIFFINAFSRSFNESRYAAGAGIVIAAVSAVLLFRPAIKGTGTLDEPVSGDFKTNASSI